MGLKRTSLAGVALLLLLGAGTGIGCGAEQTNAGSTTGEQAAARPGALPATWSPGARHPGHLANKRVTKPVQPPALALVPARPAPSADLPARQAAYLEKWRTLQPTIAHLPAEQQELQRAALKRAELGE